MQEAVSIVSLIILVLIHLYANRAQVLGWAWHGRFLSFASGVSFAYVFVDLLPMLAVYQPVLQSTFKGVIPLLDKHAYIIALFGVLFYYGLRRQPFLNPKKQFYVTMSGYQLFNFLVGASLADINDPEIQPIALFTIAMGLHYFVNDHTLRQDHKELYEKSGRWWLAAALIVGYIVGDFLHIPGALEALIIAFVAGGVLLNVMSYELPKNKSGDYFYFVLGALLYTILLVQLGH
jgi:hypothetical protein